MKPKTKRLLKDIASTGAAGALLVYAGYFLLIWILMLTDRW